MRTRKPLAGALVALAALAPAAEAGLLTQGAYRAGADALWTRGLTGAGQTVAILDLGFANLDTSIAAGELPPRETLRTMSFDAADGLDGSSAVGAVTEHGVRMAEIVHDLAPHAQLVLVNYHTIADFERAVDWLIAERIPIVTHSNSILTPPHDGTGRLARAVDRAAAAGILWFNSAGNYGERHWEGPVDAAGVTLPIAPRAGDTLAMSLGWRNAPPGTTVDLILERQAPDGTWGEVARSGPDPELPGGPAGQTPVLTADGAPYRVVLRASAGGPALVEVFSRTVGFGANAVPAGSIPTPGDAAGAITVAAVTWTVDTLAPYSSRGPTDEGSAKPDIAAPTYVTSNAAWPSTAGTSAATPHVAAGAALVRQSRQLAGLPTDVATIRADLVTNAVDLGDLGADLGFGAGMLRLDLQTPRVEVRVVGARGRRPTVRVRVLDDGTVGTVRIALDGREIAQRRSPRVALRLPALRPGRHTVAVRAGDLAGNVGARTVRFRSLG